MRKVERSELLDFQTYNDQREELRRRVLEEKGKRRIHLGEYLTFLFESTDTIRYQVQEMMRLEQIVREKDIQHELDTYNQLLGGPGELGCTLLIEIDDEAERNEKLHAWLELPAHVYLKLEDGSRVPAVWDTAQVDTRLSSVQYLKFPVGAKAVAAIGCDHPALCDPSRGGNACDPSRGGNALESELTAEQRQTLAQDLAS